LVVTSTLLNAVTPRRMISQRMRLRRLELQSNSLIESGAGNCDSLLSINNSLLRLLGNFTKKRSKSAGFSDRICAKSPRIGEIPCIFPDDQGIRRGEWFAADWIIRHRVPISGDTSFESPKSPPRRPHLQICGRGENHFPPGEA
jgi:hypothetical protein